MHHIYFREVTHSTRNRDRADESRTEYFLQGITTTGERFRPSDWSERLCGVMSSFGPGASGRNAKLKYSLYVRPVILAGIKCVVVDERLKDLEPMAFSFVMNFAKDNCLVVTEACSLPDESAEAVQLSARAV